MEQQGKKVSCSWETQENNGRRKFYDFIMGQKGLLAVNDCDVKDLQFSLKSVYIVYMYEGFVVSRDDKIGGWQANGSLIIWG